MLIFYTFVIWSAFWRRMSIDPSLCGDMLPRDNSSLADANHNSRPTVQDGGTAQQFALFELARRRYWRLVGKRGPPGKKLKTIVFTWGIWTTQYYLWHECGWKGLREPFIVFFQSVRMYTCAWIAIGLNIDCQATRYVGLYIGCKWYKIVCSIAFLNWR